MTIYKHSDGYPDGAVCWITKALEHAWPLPRFEADEFAAGFVAANKPSAKTRRMDFIAKVEREADPEKKLRLLEAAENYGPGGRYADCVGGGVRLVNRHGLDAFSGSLVGRVRPCVRPVCAVHMTAGHNALRGSVPVKSSHLKMRWHIVGCPSVAQIVPPIRVAPGRWEA